MEPGARSKRWSDERTGAEFEVRFRDRVGHCSGVAARGVAKVERGEIFEGVRPLDVDVLVDGARAAGSQSAAFKVATLGVLHIEGVAALQAAIV